jgi:hypothetical protein
VNKVFFIKKFFGYSKKGVIFVYLLKIIMVIAIDFDGTCVTHEFPSIGKDIKAVPVLRDIIKRGHQLILFTMRSDGKRGLYLTEALDWFKDNNIPLYGIQKNPTQHTWTSSPKAFAQMYIDDAALGCPLKYDKGYSDRAYVDWERVRELLEGEGII